MIESRALQGRKFQTFDLVIGEDELPKASEFRDRIVRVRVDVPPEGRDAWENGLAAEIDDLLQVAFHAYPVEVTYRRTAEESERRVIEAPDPEGQLREYVEGLTLNEADSAAVIELGLDVIHEAGIL